MTHPTIVNYSKDVLNDTDFKIFVSDKLIRFNLVSLETAVIKSKYKSDYSPFMNLTTKDLRMIAHVRDSLSKAEKRLNEDFEQSSSTSIEMDSLGYYNYLLFLSNKVDGQIYAELVPYNGEITKSIKYDEVAFGKVFTFLFNVNEKNIITEVLVDSVNFD